MRKNYMTAKEAEMEMQKVRKDKGLTGKTEQVLVTNMIENAKMSSVIGDKLQIVINPMYIHIPEWQRNIDKTRALSIGSNYNKYKWDVPKVLFDNGRLYVIDGQHRIYGAFMGHKDRVVVEILECSKEEAIDIFLNQSKDRKKMSPTDVYAAALEGNKANYIALRDTCHKHGVAIKGEYMPNAVGVFTVISDGIRMDIKTLDSILGLLGKLEWNAYSNSYKGKAYTAKFIRALKAMYSYYSGREKEMEDILIRRCRGTEWFTDNIMDMAQGQIFDYLSNIVKYEMENKIHVVKKGRAV